MQLDSSAIEKLLKSLEENWEEPRNCQICNENNWDVSSRVFELREHKKGLLVIGGDSKVVPLISVTCNKCGNALLFNAIKLGLVNKEDELGV